MDKGYFVINGYRERREKIGNSEKIIIELLKDGEFFTQTTLPDDITKEQYDSVITYLEEMFEDNDGTGAGAMITILSYIQNI